MNCYKNYLSCCVSEEGFILNFDKVSCKDKLYDKFKNSDMFDKDSISYTTFNNHDEYWHPYTEYSISSVKCRNVEELLAALNIISKFFHKANNGRTFYGDDLYLNGCLALSAEEVDDSMYMSYHEELKRLVDYYNLIHNSDNADLVKLLCDKVFKLTDCTFELDDDQLRVIKNIIVSLDGVFDTLNNRDNNIQFKK